MKFIFLFCVFFVGKSAAKVALKDLIPVCDIKDPKLNECVVNSANLMIPAMVKGIRDYGIPSIDPLLVPKMDVGQKGGPISLTLDLVNTTQTGLGRMKFHSASIDTKRNRWVLNGTIPEFIVDGKYTGDGQILLVRFVGEGDAQFKFKNTGITFVIKGVPKDDGKGNVYFKLDSVKIYFNFSKDVFFSLTNLFGGNKELGETTNRFLNENSYEVVSGLQGTLEEIYSVLYTGLLKRMFSAVPYNQIFQNV